MSENHGNFNKGDRVLYDGQEWIVTGSYDRRHPEDQVNLKRRDQTGKTQFAYASSYELSTVKG